MGNIPVLFGLLLFSSVAYSECFPGYCIGTGTEVVRTATVTQTGVLFMAPTDGTNLNCTLIESVYIKLDNTHAYFDEIYASYLAATARQQYFQLGIDGSPSCTVSYIRIWN